MKASTIFSIFPKKLRLACVCLLGMATLSAQTQLGADINGEAADDLSGGAVSLTPDGQTVAIGAIRNDGNGSNTGHVRVFKRISGTWTQQGADIDGEAASDWFGWSVSISADGQTLAAGAIHNAGNGTDAGHVRVYKLISGTWTQQGADLDGEAAGDFSGQAVSLSADGQTLAIGADGNDGNGTNAGHVRVFKLISGTWTQQGADIDGEAAGDFSGQSLNLSPDGLTLAVGATGNDANGSNSGSVRVYQFISGTWTQQGADIDGEAADDLSGISVSLSSDGLTVAIGANRNDATGTNAGHVRVYKLISGTWTQQGADIDGEATGDFSGQSLSLSADGLALAVGAPGNDSNNSNTGQTRVYKFISGTWVQQGADMDGEGAIDQAGSSVSLSADGLTVAIGASLNDGNGLNSGHVRVYQIPEPCSAPGAILYVNASAPSGGTGASWACAFKNLQDAIDAASPGQEIWVKAGAYLPTKDPFGNAAPTDPRNKTFLLKNGVALYGGFAGTETLRSQRNWFGYTTTLSGNLGNVGDFSDNCYHVVLSVNDDNTTVLDGFTISGGNANGTLNLTGVEGTYTVSQGKGGGLCHLASALSTVYTRFKFNTGTLGAGAFSDAASAPTYSNCIFSGNMATSNGGALYQAAATLMNCTVTGNSAGTSCGGVFNQSSSTLTNCLVWNNRVGTTTGSANANFVGSTANVTYSLLQSLNPSGTGNLNGIPNAADSNYPKFVTPLDPATAPSGSGNFLLTPCSPVINLGINQNLPARDISYSPRLFGTNVDMGANEMWLNPTYANAGPDQTGASTCGQTTVTLAANAPAPGTWSIVSGTGGSFSDATSPSSTFSGNAGQAYTLRWTINPGTCTSTDDMLVTFNQIPAIGFTPTKPTCFGGSGGKLKANPSGASGTFAYAWSNGGNTREITGLAAGTYTVTVTVAPSGCTATATTTLTEPAAVTLSFSTINNKCFGESLGKITASASGGTGTKTFVWNTGATTNLIQNLPAGTYTTTATDTKGCTASGSASLADPTQLMLSHTVETLANGKFKVTLAASGGTPFTTGVPYRYCRLTTTCAFGTASSFTNLVAGTYTFRARDKNLCETEITVTAPPPPSQNRAVVFSEKTDAPAFSLAPNPFENQLTCTVSGLENASPGKFRAQVFDAAGRMVFEKTLSADARSFEIEQAAGWLPGVFFVKILGENGRTAQVLRAVKI